MDVGNKIKQLRIEKGITQQKLADDLSIARSTLACYETNQSQIPNELLVAFAKYFDVTTDYLLDLDETNNYG